MASQRFSGLVICVVLGAGAAFEVAAQPTSLVAEVFDRIQIPGHTPGPDYPWQYPADGTYLIIAGDQFVSETASRLDEFAQWKRQKGFLVHVTPVSALTPEASVSSEDVIEHIRQVYNREPPFGDVPPLRYVALVGDSTGTETSLSEMPIVTVPTFREDIGEVYFSDEPYVQNLARGGADPFYRFSGAVVGRLSVTTVGECASVIGKLLRYERDPDPGTWYNRFLGVAYYEDINPMNGYEDGSNAQDVTATVYTALKRHCGINAGLDDSTLMITGVPYPPNQYPEYHFVRSSLRPSRVRIQKWAWGNDLHTSGMPDPEPEWLKSHFLRAETEVGDEVNRALNGELTDSGVGCVLYKGHGVWTGWTNRIQYNEGHIANLRNGVQTPVVFSMTCATASFCHSTFPRCMGENLLRMDSGGCIGFCGWTGSGMGTFDHPCTYGIFAALFGPDFDPGALSYPNSGTKAVEGPATRVVAEALACGKAWMRRCGEAGEVGGYSESLCERSWHSITWLGDPEMMLRTRAPQVLTVAHPPFLPEQGGAFPVIVTAEESPVSAARVALVLLDDSQEPVPDAIPLVALTDATGTAVISTPTVYPERYALTVTASDAVPFQRLLTPPSPEALFAVSQDTENPLKIVLQDLSTSGFSPIEFWGWDFGDGSGSNEQSPVHTYAATGTYQIQLTVANAYGADTFQTEFNVVSMPVGTAASVLLVLSMVMAGATRLRSQQRQSP